MLDRVCPILVVFVRPHVSGQASVREEMVNGF